MRTSWTAGRVIEVPSRTKIPRHRVYLDAFYIDAYEVTNMRFQQFVRDTGHRTQAEREGWGYVSSGDKVSTGQQCPLACTGVQTATLRVWSSIPLCR